MRAAHLDLFETHLIGAKTKERLVGQERCPALGALGIELCGWSEAVAPYRMVRPALGFGEVLVGVSGRGRVWVDGDWREMGAGEAYVAPRGAEQAFYPLPGRRWRFVWVHYSERPGRARVVPGERVRVVAADARPLAAGVDALAAEVAGAADAKVLGHLAAWVDLAARRIARGARPVEERLSAVWAAVEAELGRHWDARALARVAGVGPEQLRRLCQAAHGTSPLDHLARLRMDRAAALLRGTPLKVEAIADAVGYGGVFAFSAAFKRRHGVAPTHFRREARG
jgi:AraC-like DNA-binding protein